MKNPLKALANLLFLPVEPPKTIDPTQEQQAVLDALNTDSPVNWVMGYDGGKVCYQTEEAVKDPGTFMTIFEKEIQAGVVPVECMDAPVTIPVKTLSADHIEAIKAFEFGGLLDPRAYDDFESSKIIFAVQVGSGLR